MRRPASPIARAAWALLAVLCLLLAASAAAAKGKDEGKGKHKDGGEEPKDAEHAETDGEASGDGHEDETRDRDGEDDGGHDADGDGTRERRHRHASEDGEPRRRVRAPQPEPEPAAKPAVTVRSSASVQVLVTPTAGQLLVTVLAARGAGDPATVTLDATLPDVGSEWTLADTAADGSACSLGATPGVRLVGPSDGATPGGTALSCSLRLAAGEVSLVQASAPVEAPPGWAAEATAHVAAPGDGQPADDAGAAQAGLLLL